MTGPQATVRNWLDAIESRDVDAVVACFTAQATWQNIPEPAAVGHQQIRAMLATIFARSEWVRWDIVSSAYAEHRAWLERVDRFFIDGTEYAVRCNGVLEFDAETGLIIELRDYVDLTEWRSRLAAAEL